ncbi:hypothetical protein M3Y99_01054800 [Aphelenchoides fujianensis]|nr:hypothetical protein M3Y99_01054800 [Aphelenchoides fujianensis]
MKDWFWSGHKILSYSKNVSITSVAALRKYSKPKSYVKRNARTSRRFASAAFRSIVSYRPVDGDELLERERERRQPQQQEEERRRRHRRLRHVDDASEGSNYSLPGQHPPVRHRMEVPRRRVVLRAACCGKERNEPTDLFPWIMGFSLFLLIGFNLVFIACMHRRRQRTYRSYLSSVAVPLTSANTRPERRNEQPRPITTTSVPPVKPADRRPPTATCGTQTFSTAVESVQLAPPSYLQAVLSEDAAVAQQTSPPHYSSLLF